MTKIAISVDDGSYDSYKNIFPLLKKYGLPATFNIIPGYIDGGKEVKGIPYKPITWAEFENIVNSPLIEIGNHSYDHTNKLDSIERGRSILNQHLGRHAKSPIGFASPESKLTETVVFTIKNDLIRYGCSYIRTGLRIRFFKFLRILSRKAARITHFSWLFIIAYHDTLLNKEDTFILYSIPIMKDTTLKEVMGLIHHAIRQKKNLILLFHRVLKPEEDNYKESWYWDYEKFKCLLSFLSYEQTKGELRVVKTYDLQTGENE